MCGISGILSFSEKRVDRQDLKKMTDRIAYRGPDAEGFWLSREGQVGFGHRRLSILDLSDAGRQPMHYADGRYTITFNGEIYNFVELKAELESKGYSFSTLTDTEVILALFADRGVACLEAFDGMFAFAIWDDQEKTLFCARDRMGEKPFYYHHDRGRSFVFGSEIKCLFAAGVARRVREDRLFSYLAYESVEDPHDLTSTFFDGVRQLEPAHFLLIRAGAVTTQRYWEAPPESASPPPLDEACAKFVELFETSIRRRLRSDVPVGTCLSGGLDSSSIVVELGKMGITSQKTFSARVHDPRLDEGQYMKEVIDRTSVDPHFTWLDPDAAISQLEAVSAHQEEPFNTTSCLAQWFVMKLAAEQGVTVLIDGQGADEILAGYEGYHAIHFRELYLSDPARLATELAAYERVKGKPFQFDLRFKLEARFPGVLGLLGRAGRKLGRGSAFNGLHPDRVQRQHRAPTPFRRITHLNEALRHSSFLRGLSHLLRLCDRNSMAFSREVRLPFLSRDLVDFVFTLPASYKIHEGWSKFLLRKSLAPLLPESIAWRRDKIGFAAPQKEWYGNPKLRERFRASTLLLQKEGWITEPVPGKDWQYLQAALLLRGPDRT